MGFTKVIYPRHRQDGIQLVERDRQSIPEVTKQQARAAGLTVVARLAPQDARTVLQQLGLKPYDRPDAQQPHP